MFISNRVIIQEGFIDALSRLLNIDMPAKQCLEVSRSIDELVGQLNIVLRVRKTIADKYCKKDEKGIPICDENGLIVFENEELKEAFLKEINEVLEEGIDISLSEKIKIKGDTVKMTPLTYKLLEDLIEIV